MSCIAFLEALRGTASTSEFSPRYGLVGVAGEGVADSIGDGDANGDADANADAAGSSAGCAFDSSTETAAFAGCGSLPFAGSPRVR